MASYICWDYSCKAQFPTENLRDGHHSTNHPQLEKDAVRLLVNEVINTNGPEGIRKKVVDTPIGRFSFKEVNNMDLQKNPAVAEVLTKPILFWLTKNPDKNLKDFFFLNEFKIK